MATRNAQLVDESIKRDKQLQARALAILDVAIALMDASEPELRVLLERYLAELTQPGTDLSSPVIQLRLSQMRNDVSALRTRYMNFVADNTRTQTEELIRDEWSFLVKTYAAGAGLSLVTPSGATVEQILTTPFLGRDFDTWMSDLAASDVNRISDQVVVGLIQGRSRQEILESVLGTADADGSNGATQITRNHMRSIIDSGVVGIAAQARRDLVEENDELLPRELYVAVLDGRTTQICRSLNGRVFPAGLGPIPPIHWNCRSTRVPLPADGEVPKVT